MTESVDTASICPWCSAEVPAGGTTCAACGANLVETADPSVPGLTAIDPEAVLRSVRTTGQPARRNRILSLITGEEPEDGQAAPGSPTALAPPPPDVRREMLRMEIAAELSNLTAEVDSITADEAIEGGTDEQSGAATAADVAAPPATERDVEDAAPAAEPEPES
jgi:hypothetical protein